MWETKKDGKPRARVVPRLFPCMASLHPGLFPTKGRGPSPFSSLTVKGIARLGTLSLTFPTIMHSLDLHSRALPPTPPYPHPAAGASIAMATDRQDGTLDGSCRALSMPANLGCHGNRQTDRDGSLDGIVVVDEVLVVAGGLDRVAELLDVEQDVVQDALLRNLHVQPNLALF